MRSRGWKWIGLGAIAAIAVGSAVVVERRRRRWRQYDPAEIRDRLHQRFSEIDTRGECPRGGSPAEQ